MPSLSIVDVPGAALGVACPHDLARPLLAPALLLPLILLLADDRRRT